MKYPNLPCEPQSPSFESVTSILGIDGIRRGSDDAFSKYKSSDEWSDIIQYAEIWLVDFLEESMTRVNFSIHTDVSNVSYSRSKKRRKWSFFGGTYESEHWIETNNMQRTRWFIGWQLVRSENALLNGVQWSFRDNDVIVTSSVKMTHFLHVNDIQVTTNLFQTSLDININSKLKFCFLTHSDLPTQNFQLLRNILKNLMSHTFGKRVFSHVVAEYEVMYMLHGDRPIRIWVMIVTSLLRKCNGWAGEGKEGTNKRMIIGQPMRGRRWLKWTL